MGLFSQRGGRGNGVRDQACVYNGEPFPQRGERLSMGGSLDCEIIVDRAELPPTWTGVAEMIRTYTGEPQQRAVLMNILGTFMAMTEMSVTNLGRAFDLGAHVDQAVATMRRGDDQIGNVSYIFGVDDRGPEFFQFELVKHASLLAAPQAQQARQQQGWPYPDIWGGDAAAFPYPY